MLDWNHDERMDCKDHVFYNNVVETGMKKDEKSSGGYKCSSPSSLVESSGKSGAIFIGIGVLYLFIKLIGGLSKMVI